MMFDLSEQKKMVLEAHGNMLIVGGPGSGKTTIALLKAKVEIESKTYGNEQKILFLSFARSTVSRIESQLKGVFDTSLSRSIEITTYHSFFWTLLKSHGYLLNKVPFRILVPHDAAIRLSGYKKQDKVEEMKRLCREEGLMHFDLFAPKCVELLKGSKSLTRIITSAYPLIILDEFQDTDSYEWELVKVLGERSTIISLADPEQRIYDFRGADPARIKQFIDTFHPQIFDFGIENNRSKGTDIVQFGNDLLTGQNIGKSYNNVVIYTYSPKKNNLQLLSLKWLLLERIACLTKQYIDRSWSVAILLPSNRLMLTVSDFLSTRHEYSNGRVCPAIEHDVSIDSAGPSISAITIALLLEEGSQRICSVNTVIRQLCEYILGHRGDKPAPASEQQLVDALQIFISSDAERRTIKGSTRQLIVHECEEIANICNCITYSGNIVNDWIEIRKAFQDKKSECLGSIYKDAHFIKLLHKGSALYMGLDQIWRKNKNYKGAFDTVQNALLQEHFLTSQKTWTGVNVMTIHKAKGKEFDEVIVWEGAFDGERYVYKDEYYKAQLNLRVAVTRAKANAFIFTPLYNKCVLLER